MANYTEEDWASWEATHGSPRPHPGYTRIIKGLVTPFTAQPDWSDAEPEVIEDEGAVRDRLEGSNSVDLHTSVPWDGSLPKWGAFSGNDAGMAGGLSGAMSAIDRTYPVGGYTEGWLERDSSADISRSVSRTFLALGTRRYYAGGGDAKTKDYSATVTITIPANESASTQVVVSGTSNFPGGWLDTSQIGRIRLEPPHVPAVLNSSGSSGQQEGGENNSVRLLPVEIDVKKKGDDVAPADGVVVEKGETLEIKLTDTPQESFEVGSGTEPVAKRFY